MLNKDLCKAFNIPAFIQWLMSELDLLEDILHSSKIDPDMYEKTKSRYDVLIEVRDKYFELR